MVEDRFEANPSLVIGLGGTGLIVATHVQKSIWEINRNRLARKMAILVFDTMQIVDYQAGGRGRERTERHATGPVKISGGQYVPLVGNVKALGEDIKREQLRAAGRPEIRRGQPHRHISGWFQAEHYIDERGVDDSVWNLDIGAGRFRQFGRLALFSRITRASEMLSNVLGAVRRMGATQLYVHVAGSLAGGTGAGLIVDIAHLVKQLAADAGFRQSPVVFGHFVLAEGFRGTPNVDLGKPGRKADFDARCYAALRELTRLQGTVPQRTGGYPITYNTSDSGALNARLEKSPYTWVYLYDGLRENNPLNEKMIQEGLGPAIADAIVAYIDDLSAGAFCKHSVNYQAFYPAAGIPAGQVTYGSVGTYTIELPIYHITEGWAHSLAREVLDYLLLGSPEEEDEEGDRQRNALQTGLETRRPGGERRDPATDADTWLKDSTTEIVQRLAEWGTKAAKTATLHQQTVDAVLGRDAQSWRLELAPSDPGWRQYVADAQTELEGSLKDKASLKYYVDHDQPGETNEDRASNLQDEVDAKLGMMVGETRDVWMREGGDFRRALVRLGNHHVESFDAGLMRWLNLKLNGDPHIGTSAEQKQGKLGYAKAFVEQIDSVLRESARVLSDAAVQSKKKRRPVYDGIESARKAAAADMQQSSGFRGGRLRTYRDRSDDLAQFHKADIARQVVYDLVGRLQKTVGQVQKEIERWEEIVGTASADTGGAYALILEGQNEIEVDRKNSEDRVRWVIADNEPGDKYIEESYQRYSRGRLGEIFSAIEWRIGRTDGTGPIKIELTLNGTPWNRRAGSAGQRAIGEGNVAMLLGECRAAFEDAWAGMSVTEYLYQNFNEQVEVLADRVYSHSGYALSLSRPTDEPPHRTTFVRVYQEGLDTDRTSFLTRLRTSVAERFQDSSTAEQRAQAVEGGDYISRSGEPSRDPFKLTFVMFGDLLRPELIAGYAGAQKSYHTVSGRESDWKTLQVFPAETNALSIERKLGVGHQKTQQRRRELSDEVVAVLEDFDRFHLAMHCLAYGETDFDWEVAGERGVLLHRFTPPRAENRRGYSYWRLTVEPVGVRHADGRPHTPDGRMATPEHYQLTPMASEPDLLQAFVQFTCAGKEWGGNKRIDTDRVGATLQGMMDRHMQRWRSDEEDMGLVPTEKTRRQPQLLEDAQDLGARMIGLSMLIDWADQALAEHRWAWAPGDTPPPNMEPADQAKIQSYVDLWTALRGAAKEELGSLGQRFSDLAMWRGEIPKARKSLQAGVATEPELSEEEEAVELTIPEDSGWTCSQGHANSDEEDFCLQCGERRPDLSTTPVSEETEIPETRMCEQGHEMPSAAKFCPECGSPPRVEERAGLRVCEHGHEMPPTAKFCPECGSPPRVEEPEKARVCEQGHEMPPTAKFCPECGSPPRMEEQAKLRVCENGHEMPPEAKFCLECGSPPRT